MPAAANVSAMPSLLRWQARLLGQPTLTVRFDAIDGSVALAEVGNGPSERRIIRHLRLEDVVGESRALRALRVQRLVSNAKNRDPAVAQRSAEKVRGGRKRGR